MLEPASSIAPQCRAHQGNILWSTHTAGVHAASRRGSAARGAAPRREEEGAGLGGTLTWQGAVERG